MKLRADLVISRQGGAEDFTFVVKDPITERFFRFKEPEHFIAQQFDGATSQDIVRQRVQERFGVELSPENLEQFISRLQRLGLLTDVEAQAATQPSRRRRAGGDVFYLRYRLFDPDRFFDWLLPRVRFLFTPQFLALSAVLIVCAFGVTAVHWGEIMHEFRGLFRLESLVLAWFTLLGTVTLHEFAHGLTCKHFGGRVREIGCLLIYFQPAFYCNVSDAWLFPEKAQRLWVTFAGAYFELFLWALCTLVWRVTDPSTTLNHLALLVVATSAVKSFFNLNPLIKLDGYYLLSDWLEIPNLRQKAFGYLGTRVKGLFGLGDGTPQEVTVRERRIYVVYGLLAGAYTYWLLAMVAAYFGSFLIARYEGWGFIVFVTLLAGVFRRSIGRFFNGLRAAFTAGGTKLRVAVKSGKWLLFFCALAAGLYFCRMELKVSGEFTVLPIHNADVRAGVEGIIQDIPHDEGDFVERDEVIAILNDRDIRVELRKLAAEINEKQAKLRLLKAGARLEEIDLARALVSKAGGRLDHARIVLEIHQKLFKTQASSKIEHEEARHMASVCEKELEEANDRLKLLLAGSRPEEIEALEAEINRLSAQQYYLEEQLNLLTVHSPVAGVIITRRLKERIGELVKKGDLIAEVHELATVTAEIAVSEKDISDVKLGQRVVLKARAHPHTGFEGTVTAITPVATPPGEGQQQRHFLVITRLDNASLLLRPEMSGRAKIYCCEQRAIELVLRRIVRSLRVEFWSWW